MVKDRGDAGEGGRSEGEVSAWRLLCGRGDGALAGGGLCDVLIERVESELGAGGRPTPAQVVAWRGAADGLLRDVVGDRGGVDASGLVFAVIELVRARRASGWKIRAIGGDERGAMLDVAGGEQATGWPIAAHVARRFVRAAGDSRGEAVVIDGCCGVGGQAVEFVRAGLNVLAVDNDAARAEMARWNVGGQAEFVVGDVGGVDVRGRLVHVDPGRRVERGDRAGRRVFDLDGMTPGWEVVDAMLRTSVKGERGGGGGVKLGPGVDVGEVAGRSSVVGEMEYISLGGVLRQAMWWAGALRDGNERRATGVGMDGRLLYSLAGACSDGVLDECEVGRYVWTVDPAVERAGLLMQLARSVRAGHVYPGLGLLTSDVLIGGDVEHAGALQWFGVLEVQPWRRERVREVVRALGGGVVEVKTRGKACDPDVEQRELRGSGERRLVVFVLRFGRAVRAIVAERL